MLSATKQLGASDYDHDQLAGFVANEHIDWTASQASKINNANVNGVTLSGTGGPITLGPGAFFLLSHNSGIDIELSEVVPGSVYSLAIDNVMASSTGQNIQNVAGSGSGATVPGVNCLINGYKNTGSTGQFYAFSQYGSVTAGYINSSGDIKVSAFGAFALGYSNSATDIEAAAVNTIQLGPGTNNEAGSISAGTGVRIHSSIPASPRNGDIWVDGGDVKIRSGDSTITIN